MALEIPSKAELDAATPEEIAAVAGALLERLPKNGWLPPEVFMPVRERVRMSTLDVVGFQAGTNGERVLVGQRGALPGDRWWAGQQNISAGVIQPRTENLEPMELRMADGRLVDLGGARVSQDITTPADRILNKEFGHSIRRVAPVRELMRFWVDTPYDISENKICTWTEVELAPGHDEVIGGCFYDTEEIVQNPPKNLVAAHYYFIERGREALQTAQ